MRVDEHTIILDESPVFYRSAPAGSLPSLYLHSVPTSSDDWTELLQESGGIAPDLIGFGRSGKGGHLDYSLNGLTAFVLRLLEHLQLLRVNVVGHGWGAALAVSLASEQPERVGRLALYNPLPLIDNFHWPRLARLWRRPVIGELVMGATTRALLARNLRRGATNPEQVWPSDRIEALWTQFDQGTQRAILRLHRAAPETQLAQIGRIQAEALLVWGKQDPWLAAGLAGPYAEQFPHMTVEFIEDAGHWPWLESPRARDLVREFLN